MAPPTVAVIGCGPGGMSFLHALAHHRQKLEREGDEEGLSTKLPIVTVFERSSEPGGVWRSNKKKPSTENTAATKEVDDNTRYDSESDESDEDSGDESDSSEESWDYIVENKVDSTTSMYDALWTNGLNQTLEYFDYTFDEHFKQALPLFLPRGPIMEYMMKRVTRNNPDIFDPVRFNTTVKHATYDEVMEKFVIQSVDTITGEKKTEFFDKCIWAAGENGCKRIPKSIHTILQEGKFEGVTVHSSEAGGILGDFKGKRIVMIGDGLSAEDLSLQGLKLGVEKIFVISRSGVGVCSETTAWPGDRVEVITKMVISKVIQGGSGLQLAEMEFDMKSSKTTNVDGGEIRELTDISAVIYCTGYEGNFGMMDAAISDSLEGEGFKKKNILPSDWKMESNPFTEEMGDVKPSKVLAEYCREYIYVPRSLYHGINMDNNNMFFLHEYSEFPLLEIDVRAWYYVAIIVGNLKLPSKKEMKNEIYSTLRKGMQLPLIRMQLDPAYYEEAIELWNDENHWSNDDYDPRCNDMEREAQTFSLQQLGKEMKESGYPSQLLSSNDDDDELNEKGVMLREMIIRSDHERFRLQKSSWRTFRDVDPSGFVSLHTGTASVPFKDCWMDLNDNDPRAHLSSLLQAE